jgi:uncharacterized protein (DUF736 family)
MQEQRDNSGALFKNEKKSSDKAPDYRGEVMVNGQKMEIAGWIKKSKAGKMYMSLAFKPPYQAQQQSEDTPY